MRSASVMAGPYPANAALTVMAVGRASTRGGPSATHVGMPLVIGIDSSTQSTKAELRYIDTGELIASGRAAHPAARPPGSEQDPRAWWAALVDAVSQLGDRRSDAVAISVAAQQHGLVLLDGHGEVLRPAKLWNDTTSSAQADWLTNELGLEWWVDWAGVVPVAAFTITKLAWVAENEPDVIGRTAMVMLPHDYLTWRLCGEHVTDRGDASGTGWYDATRDATLQQPLELATRDGAAWLDRVPRVLDARAAAGPLLDTVAAELGLPETVVVAAGTGDNMGAALGLGLVDGDAVISLGTSGTVYTRTEKRAADTDGIVAGFCDATGNYLPLVCTLNATKITDTVARWLGTEPSALAGMALDAGTDLIDATLVPYFDGERTPNLPNARNATSREELARAAHDGVLCGLLDGLDALERSGAGVAGRLLLVGGGAQSATYRQRLADISRREVNVPINEEVVAVGAAVQAAVIASDDDFDETAMRWGLRDSSTTEPRVGADGAEIRERYSAAVAAAIGSNDERAESAERREPDVNTG